MADRRHSGGGSKSTPSRLRSGSPDQLSPNITRRRGPSSSSSSKARPSRLNAQAVSERASEPADDPLENTLTEASAGAASFDPSATITIDPEEAEKAKAAPAAATQADADSKHDRGKKPAKTVQREGEFRNYSRELKAIKDKAKSKVKRERSGNSFSNDTMEVHIYGQEGVAVTEHVQRKAADAGQPAVASGSSAEEERHPSKSLREQIKEGKKKHNSKSVNRQGSKEWDVEFVLTDRMQTYFEARTDGQPTKGGGDDGAIQRSSSAVEEGESTSRQESGGADMEKICQALEDALGEDPSTGSSSIPTAGGEPVTTSAEPPAKPAVSTEQLKEVVAATRALSSRVQRLRNACVHRLGQKTFTEVYVHLSQHSTMVQDDDGASASLRSPAAAA